MQLILHQFDLSLKHVFTIAHDSRKVQRTLIVELRDGNMSGYGEATENPYYGITWQAMAEKLEDLRDQIETYDMDSPEDFWQALRFSFKELPFAQCALDMAAHDLHGKRLGKPLYKLWGLNPGRAPLTNYTIGIDTIEKMVEKMKEFPWPLYKIKLGTPHDLDIIRELRKHTSAKFRVDANCAWNAEETIKNSHELKKLGVEFIEQPMKANDWEGMKEAYRESALPLIADESCIVEEDVARCKGYFHGVNIKLMKCGGLTPARRMIEEAKKLGLKTMVGCMTESSVGISAIAQLAPMLDYVDMDGAMLLEYDIADGVKITPEGVEFSPLSGTGVVLYGGKRG